MSIITPNAILTGYPPRITMFRNPPIPAAPVSDTFVRAPQGDLPPPNVMLSSNPGLAKPYYELGEQFYRQNRFPEAIQAFTAVLALNPGDYITLNKRGVAKANLRDYPGAFADYSEAIRLKPDFYSAYVNRGNIRAYMKDYAGAMDDYTRAIRIAPLESVAYENRAELFSSLGMKAQALQDKAMAIQVQRLKGPTPVHSGLRQCPKRIALVMGNDDYAGTENDLGGGPTHDATEMKRVLESQGFEVVFAHNQTAVQMQASVKQFMDRLRQNPGAVSFIYYSGHGGSIQGNNYLIPTDYVKGYPPEWFLRNTVSVNGILQQLKTVPTTFNMLVIDACRNPLFDAQLESAGASLPVKRNWESEPAPGLSNVWIEYASRPLKPALQWGNEGLFTKYFLYYMQRPDLNLKEVSMYASFALEQDPIAQLEDQHSRTQTDLSQTEGFATSFSFANRCHNPFVAAG